VLIEIVAALLLSSSAPPAHSLMAVPTAHAATAAVEAQGPSDGDVKSAAKRAKTGKKKAKDPSKPKKSKAEKAAAKAATLAPDEVEDAAEPQTIVDLPPPGVRSNWKQHPSLRLGDAVRVDFEAKFQEDTRGAYPGADIAPWELHRNRIGIKGRLFKQIEFEVERELTEKELTEKDVVLGLEAASPWKDVNVNVTYMKNAQIQVGKFKIPFGLDQLTGVTHNDFVYRSLGANYLSPARDIGAMVHGKFFKKGLTYAVGAFQHDGDNARSKKIQGGDETGAGRVTGTPFRKLGLGQLELGTAVTFTRLTDDSFRPNGLRGRTALTQDTFYEPVYVKGHRRRWEADADLTVGRLSTRAEYTLVSDDRLAQGIGDQDLPDARARSWYVSGTWVITGEKKERPLKPDNDFLQGGIGAIEVGARIERLWYDSVGAASLVDASRTPRTEVILPGGEKALTLGVNWTLNRFIKVQFNAIREHVEDPGRNPVPNDEAFWSKIIRLQLVL